MRYGEQPARPAVTFGVSFDGRVTFWSAGAELLLGVSTDEAVGSPIADLAEWHLSKQHADTYEHIGVGGVWVYRNGLITRSFPAVVGKPSTPTPTGEFFVEESVIMPADEPGGPFALALSARSDTLRTYDGGPGQIAIHGRDGLGGIPGRAQSHGCVRLRTPSIDWLAAHLGPGTPVTIT